MIARAKQFVLALISCAAIYGAAPPKPKLVVAVIIDQFRYDYLTRFRSDYHGGLDQMMNQGADFTNAFYLHALTVTAVGHSVFLSGAMPAVSGIVGNAWYDQQAQQRVTSVCDWDEKVVGAAQPERGKACADADPASPRRLLVSTVGDELRTANSQSKVIGISLKARAAILPAGHRAAGAFWFDDVSGHFISSTFYMNALPPWAESFNSQNLPPEYVKRKWDGFPRWNFEGSAAHPFSKIAPSPWGNELVEKFAEAALKGERLGQGSAPDLLTVSFSSNDYVGHRVGPDAPEVRDMAIRTDQLLGELFRAIDRTVGMKNTLVVLSADHGIGSTPEVNQANKMPGSAVSVNMDTVVEAALSAKFGAGPWVIPNGGEATVYFNRDTLEKSKAPIDQVVETARQALFSDPRLHVARVYSRTQLENGVSGDFIAQAEMNGFNARRSGDLMIVLEPNAVLGGGANHFSPYVYDRHVPVLFMGPGIKPGRYDETILPNDIAPTLATLLDTATPSGSSGRVLDEMLVH